VSATTGPAPDPRVKQARARALMSVLWLLGAAAGAALLIAGHDTTPSGRAMAVLGGGLVVGVLIAFALVAVNASLARDPGRLDARGAADLLSVSTALVAVLTVVLMVAFGFEAGVVLVPMVVVGLVFFACLLGTGLWTRASARRRSGVPQP
jgi:uncharacterized membrane protein YiaA